MKQQTDSGRMEVGAWKNNNKVMLSIKDLIFKKWLVRKLVDQYISLYIIDEIIFTNAVKLWLLTLIRIHLVVNVSQVVWYREQVEEQKIKEVKPVEIDRVKEWEVEKIFKKEKKTWKMQRKYL